MQELDITNATSASITVYHHSKPDRCYKQQKRSSSQIQAGRYSGSCIVIYLLGFRATAPFKCSKDDAMSRREDELEVTIKPLVRHGDL